MKSKENKALKEYMSRLSKLYPEKILKVILFGSKVRRDGHINSDTDVLIVAKNVDGKLKNEITDLAFDIMLKYGVYIEPAIFDSKEWTKLTKVPSSFVYCVLNEGRELWSIRDSVRIKKKSKS